MKTTHNILDIGERCDSVVTMPSLRKDSRGRSPFWICCYTSASGQRLQKSTKITIKPLKGENRKNGSPKTVADKRAEALEVCLAIERAENHAKNGTLTEQQAKKIIGEILERTTGEPLRNYKVCDWLAHWLEMKGQVRAGKTMDRYRQVIRDFIASLGNRANLALSHITPKDLLAYRNSITKSGKGGPYGQSFREGSKRSIQRSSSPSI